MSNLPARDVRRLDGARGKKQVWRPHVRIRSFGAEVLDLVGIFRRPSSDSAPVILHPSLQPCMNVTSPVLKIFWRRFCCAHSLDKHVSMQCGVSDWVSFHTSAQFVTNPIATSEKCSHFTERLRSIQSCRCLRASCCDTWPTFAFLSDSRPQMCTLTGHVHRPQACSQRKIEHTVFLFHQRALNC